ncbi:MAG: molybdate ABC transporter substrate-binding protein [Cyanobacteria bacterium P01_C01_bin.72]
METSELESPKVKLTISAASSLKNVLTEIKSLYQNKYPETEVIYNFASSGSLRRQIDQGARVDIFISAAEDKINALAQEDLLLTATRQNLLHNQIVLITPKNNQPNNIKLDNFRDLTAEEINMIALGEPKSVPVGQYAQEVLTFWGISDQVNGKAVYGKDARQVLNYVATGNVDAGIVYYTDALASDRIKIVAIAPENSHAPVVYHLAVIKDSKHPEAAAEYRPPGTFELGWHRPR